MRKYIILGAAALIALWSAAPLGAEDVQIPVAKHAAFVHDEARRALQQGLARPLEEILVEIRKTFPGDVIEIEFEKDDGRYIYEIEIIRPDGRVIEVKVDAKTMAVLEVEDD